MWLVLLVLSLGSSSASARPGQAPLKRFHLVSPALQSRLSSNAAVSRNLRAVGQLHGGTAFLVERPRKDGTALMLTAQHVVTSCKPGKDRVLFQPDGMGRSLQSGVFRRVVAQSKKLDYALVEVSLPARLQKLRPVTLASSPGSGRLYSVGYPLLETPKLLAPNKRNARLVRSSVFDGVTPVGGEKDLRTKTIVSGHDTSSGRPVPIAPKFTLLGRPLFKIGRARQRASADMAAIGGASGSPIFSGQTNQVRGVLTMGGATGEVTPLQWLWAGLRGRRLRGRWQTGYTPIASVQSDLASQLSSGGIGANDRRRIQGLLSNR